MLSEKKSSKYHVVDDLIYPLGQSINYHIDIDEYRIHYMSLDDVVTKVQLGQNALLAKLNLESAFQYIPVHQGDWELLRSTLKVFISETLFL